MRALEKIALIVALMAPFATALAQLSPHAEVQAMAPLLIYDPRTDSPEQKEKKLSEFSAKVAQVKAMGVTGISVDVWWGIVQRGGANSFEWSYYDEVFARIAREGLDIIPIMSMHACGTNVGDSKNGEVIVPLPQFVLDLLPTLANGMDGRYVSELQHTSNEVISSFAINGPKRTGHPHALDLYGKFFRAFGERYSKMASHISEIVIGTGPAGELTYPSYHKHDETLEWKQGKQVNVSIAAYPNRGALQASSEVARQQFSFWLFHRYGAIERMNSAWHTNFKNFMEIDFFLKTDKFETFLKRKAFSPSALDFFDFYNGGLIDSGVNVAAEFAERMKGTDLADKVYSIKTPGVNWSFDSKVALLTSGQIASPGDQDLGYSRSLGNLFRGLLARQPQAKWKSIFTCADQGNCELHEVEGDGTREGLKDGKQVLGAYDLVKAVGRVLDHLGVRGGIENSLGFLLFYSSAANRMYNHMKDEPAFQTLTLLRMDEVLTSIPARNLIAETVKLPKLAPTPNKKLLCAEVVTQ